MRESTQDMVFYEEGIACPVILGSWLVYIFFWDYQ